MAYVDAVVPDGCAVMAHIGALRLCLALLGALFSFHNQRRTEWMSKF